MNNLRILAFVLISFTLVSSSCKKNKGAANAESSNKEEVKVMDNEKKTIPSVTVDSGYLYKETDSFTLLESNVNGDILSLLVQYGGGCEQHEWEVFTTGAYAKSLPPQITLSIEHNANNDKCRALITDTLEFSLEKIKYPGTSELIVKFRGIKDKSVRYNY